MRKFEYWSKLLLGAFIGAELFDLDQWQFYAFIILLACAVRSPYKKK